MFLLPADESLSVPASHPDAFTVPFHSPNQWPDLPEFQLVVQQYVTHMKDLSKRVDQLMAQVLGQDPGFFEPYFSKPLNMLRAFHYYSAEGSEPEGGDLGAGAHTDW